MTVASVSIMYEPKLYLKAVRHDGRLIISMQEQSQLHPNVQNEEDKTDRMTNPLYMFDFVVISLQLIFEYIFGVNVHSKKKEN